jgi:hypothetical protein
MTKDTEIKKLRSALSQIAKANTGENFYGGNYTGPCEECEDIQKIAREALKK